MSNEIIIRLIIIIAIWLFAILFLRRVIGSLILGLWGVILNPLCKNHSIREQFGKLNKWLQVSQPFKESSSRSINENHPPLDIKIYPNYINAFLRCFSPFKKWLNSRIFCQLKNKSGYKDTDNPIPKMVNPPVDNLLHTDNLAEDIKSCQPKRNDTASD